MCTVAKHPIGLFSSLCVLLLYEYSARTGSLSPVRLLESGRVVSTALQWGPTACVLHSTYPVEHSGSPCPTSLSLQPIPFSHTILARDRYNLIPQIVIEAQINYTIWRSTQQRSLTVLWGRWRTSNRPLNRRN